MTIVINENSILLDGVKYVKEHTSQPSKSNLTVTDIFERYLNVKEYNGIVEKIQIWFYGSLVRASWCATSMSWCLAQLGIMKYTISSKQENVYIMREKLKATNTARQLSKTEDLKRGDIIIFNWDSGELRSDSRKHVTSVYEDTKRTSGTVKCLGGNQDNGICIALYPMNKIDSVFRPNYSHNTI